MNLEQIKEKVNTKIAQRDLLQSQLQTLQKTKKELWVQRIRKERALEFVKQIALKTQSQLQFHLSDMVSTGLNTVFDEEYNFRVIFEIKRGKTECALYFEKEGHLIDPLDQSGLGAADVAAFCLRCAAYTMQPIYRKTIILDEPFKHLSLVHHEKTGELLKLLSEKLSIQFIIVSHSEKLTSYADKVFDVKRTNNVSKVKEIV